MFYLYISGIFSLPYHFRYVPTPATSLDFMSPFSLCIFISISSSHPVSYLTLETVFGEWRNTNLLFFFFFPLSFVLKLVLFHSIDIYMLQLAFLLGSENLISLFTSSAWKGEEMGGGSKGQYI